jgi:ribosome maturation factor RimP
VVKPLSFFNIHSGPEMSNPAVRERVMETVRAVAEDLGYLIYEAGLLLKGKNSSVVVKIDGRTPISHSDCEAYSRELTRRLDEAGLLPDYSLEVSSPGIRRQLRSVEEFERFSGSPAKVIFREGDEQRVVKGRIGRVEGGIIALHEGDNTIMIDFDAIKSANLEF